MRVLSEALVAIGGRPGVMEAERPRRNGPPAVRRGARAEDRRAHGPLAASWQSCKLFWVPPLTELTTPVIHNRRCQKRTEIKMTSQYMLHAYSSDRKLCACSTRGLHICIRMKS